MPATEADSPRKDFENSSIYPSRRLDTAEHGVFERKPAPDLIRGGCRFA